MMIELVFALYVGVTVCADANLWIASKRPGISPMDACFDVPPWLTSIRSAAASEVALVAMPGIVTFATGYAPFSEAAFLAARALNAAFILARCSWEIFIDALLFARVSAD